MNTTSEGCLGIEQVMPLIPPRFRPGQKGWVTAVEFLRRREVCHACPSYRENICTECGCLATCRATVKDSACPSPAGDHWTPVQTNPGRTVAPAA